MYLILQLWWYLSLAFLLGALAGYLVWKACGRRNIVRQLEHGYGSRTDAAAGGFVPLTQTETANIRAEIASLQAKLGETSGRLNAAVDTADKKLKRYAASVKKREDELMTQIGSLETQAANASRALEAQPGHAADLQAVREQVTAELRFLHAADLAAARDEARRELAAQHAVELKAVREQARAQEMQVLALTQAGASARRSLDAAKMHHASEHEKAREEASAAEVRQDAEKLARAKRDPEVAASRRAKNDPVKARAAGTPMAPLSDRGKAPGALTKPEGKADDLKLIWGVGPEIEKTLNELGIYHFSQIAAWTGNDASWFDGIGKAFEGRVAREKWVEQSKKLSTGWRPASDAGEKPE